KAVVSFDAIPNPKLANVILKDAGAEIDVVLHFKKIDALAIRGMPPSWLGSPKVPSGHPQALLRVVIRRTPRGAWTWPHFRQYESPNFLHFPCSLRTLAARRFCHGLSEPGFETGLPESCVIARNECSLAEFRPGVKRIWVGDDFA